MLAFGLQIMVPHSYTEFINEITYLVEKNIIPMSRIDDAVRRILRVKFVTGLFESPLADLNLTHHIGCQVYCLETLRVRVQLTSNLFLEHEEFHKSI